MGEGLRLYIHPRRQANPPSRVLKLGLRHTARFGGDRANPIYVATACSGPVIIL